MTPTCCPSESNQLLILNDCTLIALIGFLCVASTASCRSPHFLRRVTDPQHTKRQADVFSAPRDPGLVTSQNSTVFFPEITLPPVGTDGGIGFGSFEHASDRTRPAILSQFEP